MRLFFSTGLAALCLAAFSVPSALAGEKLSLNDDKSKIEFVGSKPDKSSHKGGFKKFQAEVIADWEDASNSSIRIVIDTASLWSDNEKLTGHLKNPDFFDVRKYPRATFESTSIKHQDDGSLVIEGKLEMLGEVNEVKIPMQTEVSDDSLKMVGKFKIDRTRWGMTYGAPDRINKEVEMTVELVLTR